MQVFRSLAEAQGLRGCAACLGNFDGVHRGHQALFAEARRWAEPIAFTFEPHPGKVLQPQLAPKLITLLPRKLELLEELALAAVVVQPFDVAYAKTSPAEFESSILDQLGARHLIVGGDFTYGARRAGNVETLAQAAATRGARLHVVPPVTVDGVVASSSRIREYILEGRVEAATHLLGRMFDLDGEVVRGQGRGRTIGFPTANVDSPNELRPGAGVYAVRARAQGEKEWRAGAANIGVKPTFGTNSVTMEIHLLDFQGDLYGKTLRVQFVAKLRDERRFASVGELSAQIERDVASAREAVRSAPKL